MGVCKCPVGTWSTARQGGLGQGICNPWGWVSGHRGREAPRTEAKQEAILSERPLTNTEAGRRPRANNKGGMTLRPKCDRVGYPGVGI